MSLPEAFQRYGTAIFAGQPEIVHEWSTKSGHCELYIPAVSPNGFDISFVVEQNTVILGWGTWHTHLEPEE
ncbi:MAG: hypothetical protein ACTSVG_14200, partial [Alphaproteobacteria bacterium]